MTEREHLTNQNDGSGDQDFYLPDASDPIVLGYATLRLALRDALGKSGIPSNPCWSDREIVGAIAEKLGGENTYDAAHSFVQRLTSDTSLDTQ